MLRSPALKLRSSGMDGIAPIHSIKILIKHDDNRREIIHDVFKA